MPNRKGFGALRMSDFPLLPAKVDTWERLVFVNLDADAMPLGDYLEAVPQDIAWCGLGDFRCYATLTVEVDANWKTIADGFSETYHIQTLHPELHRCMDDVHAPQEIWGHTGKSEQLYGVPSPQHQGDADRRGGLGRVRAHPGRADGRRRGRTVSCRPAPARASRWPT